MREHPPALYTTLLYTSRASPRGTSLAAFDGRGTLLSSCPASRGTAPEYWMDHHQYRLDQYWWWSIQYWDWKLRTGWNRIRSVFSVYCYQFLFTIVFLSDSDNQYFREFNKIIFCLVFLIRNFRAGFELNGVFVQQKPIFLLRQKRLSKIFHFRFFRKCWCPPSTVLWTQNSVFFKNWKMFSKAIYHEETFELL